MQLTIIAIITPLTFKQYQNGRAGDICRARCLRHGLHEAVLIASGEQRKDIKDANSRRLAGAMQI